MPSSPPPDRFQREIDDIVRLAERRLEHESFGYRVRRSTRRLSGALGNLHFGLPATETLGGGGLACLLLSWLLSLPIIPVMLVRLQPWILALGIVLLVLAIGSSIVRGRAGGGPSNGSGAKVWRGEPVAYGNPYGESFLTRLKRMFRGR